MRNANGAGNQQHIGGEENNATEQAELFADNAENKVAFRERQEQIFLPRVKQPYPEQPAATQRIKRLNQLIPFFQRRCPRIEKGRQTVQAVRFDENENGHGGNGGYADQQKVFESCPADKQHQEHQQADANGDRHIGFQDDENADPEAYADDRQNAAERRHFGVVLRHVRSRENNKTELGDFAGLQGKERQIDPSFGAVIFDADAGDKDEYQQDDRYPENNIPQLVQNVVIDERQSDHGRKPERRADQLLKQKIISVPVVDFPAVHAGGVDHQYAECDERNDDGQKHGIDFDGATLQDVSPPLQMLFRGPYNR